MLSISSVKGDGGYYSHEDNYYVSGALESRWLGEGAERLGLSGPVLNADMDAVRQGILPDGTDMSRMENGKNTHRPGYDLTLSAPKSVSMMALIAGDKRFVAAHNQAVDVVAREVEKLVSARITDEGKTDTVLTGNMVAALYNHDTSRDLDPQLHTHLLVFNLTFFQEKWRALASDTRMKTGFGETIFANQVALGNLYRQVLRGVVEQMGFETIDTGKNGLWEIKGLPVEEFSQRSQAIQEAAGPNASLKSRDVAALDTRKAKAYADPDMLVAEWKRRLEAQGVDMEAFTQQAHEREAMLAASPTPGAKPLPVDVSLAVIATLSSLSDKKVQFTASELLAGIVSRLPAEPGMFAQARAGMDAAIEQQRLIPLDREKGIFTTDIHLLNELSVHQLAHDIQQTQVVLTFPERSEERQQPRGDAITVLGQDKSPLAVLVGRGGAQVQRERLVDAVLMAREHGRDVQVLAADKRSEAFLGQDAHLAGRVMSRTGLTAELVLPAHSTLVIDQAEKLSLKDTLLLLEKGREASAQLLFMDTENRQGTGNALSVLKETGVAQYRFYDSAPPTVRLVSEPDKRTRYGELATEYVRLMGEGRDVVAQVSGVREQALLTDTIRHARRDSGELGQTLVSLAVLEPVWLDSKTRRQRDSYREGRVMEHWDAEHKMMQRYSITQVADSTNNLVLKAEDGTLRTEKISQLDGNWSLFIPHQLEVAEGERLRALGREAKGDIQAHDRLTVTGLSEGKLQVRDGEKTVMLDTSRALKLSHDYVEGLGTTVSNSRTVLAAVSQRGLNSPTVNQLARSGDDIRLYTPLSPERAAAKVVSVPAVRLVSEQVIHDTGEAGLAQAMDARREQLMQPAELAVSLALPRAQRGEISVSRVALLSESANSGVPLIALEAEIQRQIETGELLSLASVPGAGNDILVPRVAYEMEKTIIRHIAEGKEAVPPLMALTPASVLEGLTEGQRMGTRTVLENTDRFMAIQGYAGVGKTTQFRAVMSALKTLSESVRPEVIGLGPTHRAVHELQEAGVVSQTLASFLSETRQKMLAGETPDFRNVLFLTDESSMVGNRDMAELYQVVAAGGGRMVSSGDTAQLQAISTGLPFRLVQQRSAIDTVVMREIVRQTPELRPAIESIIAGQVHTALHQVEDVIPQQVPRQIGAWVPEQSVMEIRTPDEKTPQTGELVEKLQKQTPEQLSLVRTNIIEAIRDDWMGRTLEAQQQTLIVAELNVDRHAINEAIHDARHEKGDVGLEEHTLTVLEPLRVPDNALRTVETFAKYTGAVAMMNERYWTVASTDTQNGVVTLTSAEGESVLISPQHNTAQDISLFKPRELTVSQGDRVRFTRSDTDRGYVANSLWEVAGFTEDGAVRFRQGDLEKVVDPQKVTEDRHIDLAYALTVYGVQGASERFVIALFGAEGGRKMMASLESLYVTLSRAKEHIQVYTDNFAKWSNLAGQSNAGKTAHELLHHVEDRQAQTGVRLLATASPLARTALGRQVLAGNGLSGESMARFVGPGAKYPSPHVALPVWDRQGKAAGAWLAEIRLDEEGRKVSLSDEGRVLGSNEARFAGLQVSRNGQTRLADDIPSGLALAREYPDTGILVRLTGDEIPLNVKRLTGGTLVNNAPVPADVLKPHPQDDPIPFIPNERQQMEAERERLVREAAEGKAQDSLPVVPVAEKMPDDERELKRVAEQLQAQEPRDVVSEMVNRDLARSPLQRERMQQLEREWVKQPEKDITLEKTLGE